MCSSAIIWAYTVYLILKATEHDAIPSFSRTMGWFVFPMTFLTFGILLHRVLRQRRKERRGASLTPRLASPRLASPRQFDRAGVILYGFFRNRRKDWSWIG